MKTSHFVDLDLNIARARILLSVVTLVSIYLDPTVPDLTPWFRLTGGWMSIDRYALAVLVAHLVYSAGAHIAAAFGKNGRRFVFACAIGDVFFGVALAVFTEGPTSPSYVLLAFAIVAVGCREGFRMTFAVTAVSTLLYLGLVMASAETQSHDYLMRPIYFAITGFLIGYLGQQRLNFESRVRELESHQERQVIARSLHDGYVQALAAVNLRLETCRRMVAAGRVEPALAELSELRAGVAREYDQVRSYVRSLAALEHPSTATAKPGNPTFHVQADFRAPGTAAEQVLQILLEGVRNTMRHASARSARIRADERENRLSITIEDDGVGLPLGAGPPWSIASRVGDLGGAVSVADDGDGARLEIDLPAETAS